MLATLGSTSKTSSRRPRGSRNLEIIGEAVKQLPEDVRSRDPGAEWPKIAGLRDILVHAYSSVDLDIIWDIVANKLPTFEDRVRELLEKSGG